MNVFNNFYLQFTYEEFRQENRIITINGIEYYTIEKPFPVIMDKNGVVYHEIPTDDNAKKLKPLMGFFIIIKSKRKNNNPFTSNSPHYNYLLEYKEMLVTDLDIRGQEKETYFDNLEKIQGYDSINNSQIGVNKRNYNIRVQDNISGKPRSVQMPISDLSFEFQPKLSYEKEPKRNRMNIDLHSFDLCYLSMDQYLYLMNDILQNWNREGVVYVTGAKIVPGEIDFIPESERNNNVDNDGYFTLKFESYIFPENNISLSVNTSQESIINPVISIATPCPPVWNPGSFPSLAYKNFVSLHGKNVINYFNQARSFYNNVIAPLWEK